MSELMEGTMNKVREMVDANSIIGEPISTADGVTVIPISRVSFGFGTGGSDYGKSTDKFAGAGAAGVKIEPVSFLVVKDGITRVVPVAMPAVGFADRLIDMVPEIMDRIDRFAEKKKEEKDIF